MAVVGFGLLSHVPTIMLPEEVRRELNEGKEISLVPGLRRLRNEVFDELEPETFVVLDTHWASTVEHLLAAQGRRHGRYTSDELPRGMAGVLTTIPATPSWPTPPRRRRTGSDSPRTLPRTRTCRSTTRRSTCSTTSGAASGWSP